MELLLKNNANAHAKNKKGETPLDVAKQLHTDDVIPILEKAMAETGNMSLSSKAERIIESDPKFFEMMLDVEDDLNLGLFSAIWQGRMDLVERELETGDHDMLRIQDVAELRQRMKF